MRLNLLTIQLYLKTNYFTLDLAHTKVATKITVCLSPTSESKFYFVTKLWQMLLTCSNLYLNPLVPVLILCSAVSFYTVGSEVTF